MHNSTTRHYAICLIALTFILSSGTILGQVEEEKTMTVTQALQQEPIGSQFDYVIKKSNRFQDFKVIKRVFIDKLKKNTLDSLNVLENEILKTNTEFTKSKETINSLETSLADVNSQLSSVTAEKDNMTFLGIPFTKGSYKMLMWSISGVLLGLLLLFIYKFKNSNTTTVEAKKNLLEIEAEFEEHRRKALEREQKLNRKLQDELNKQRHKSNG